MLRARAKIEKYEIQKHELIERINPKNDKMLSKAYPVMKKMAQKKVGGNVYLGCKSMKFFIPVLFILFYNLALAEDNDSNKSVYKTIKLSSSSPYPMEMNELTGMFGVYAPDVAHDLMSFGWEEYTGELQDGKPHGYGERKGSDNFYKGEWKEGKYHGYGVFSQPRSDYKYAGEWQYGLREGKGILEYPWHIYLDNSHNKKYYFEYDRDVKRESYGFSFRYEGTFKDDLASGIGKCFTKEYNEQHKPTVSECKFINGVLSSKIKLPNAITIGPVKEIKKNREIPSR